MTETKLVEECYGTCRADRHSGPNYGKPHKWVKGMYDGQIRYSCSFCGRWFDAEGRSG